MDIEKIKKRQERYKRTGNVAMIHGMYENINDLIQRVEELENENAKLDTELAEEIRKYGEAIDALAHSQEQIAKLKDVLEALVFGLEQHKGCPDYMNLPISLGLLRRAKEAYNG